MVCLTKKTKNSVDYTLGFRQGKLDYRNNLKRFSKKETYFHAGYLDGWQYEKNQKKAVDNH